MKLLVPSALACTLLLFSVSKAQAKDKTAKLQGVQHKVQGKNST